MRGDPSDVSAGMGKLGKGRTGGKGNYCTTGAACWKWVLLWSVTEGNGENDLQIFQVSEVIS